MDRAQAIGKLREVLEWLEQQEPKPPKSTQPRVRELKDEAAFYNHLRSTSVLGPKISQQEFEGCKAILTHCGAAGTSLQHTAYILATAYHETAGTMQPIDEYGGNSYFTRLYDVQGIKPDRAREMENTEPGDGIRYHGRGYVQLTWKRNYRVMGGLLGVDLVKDPELAKKPDIAAQILVVGMLGGHFTGKKLGDFQSFFDMRRVVNGTDKAEQIAEYARIFARALEFGRWE